MNPFVSVIIPHYNDLENLRVCLELLAEQTYPRADFEIVVADNNSRCGLPPVEAIAAGTARVILAAEQGAGPARNAAAAASTGTVLAFIDSDCVPARDWIEKGVAALGRADFIGGRVNVLPAVPGRLSATEAFETVFAFDFASYVRDKGFTGSGNMFVRRAVFDAVGGFRNTVSEDMEWSHRVTEQGFRLAYADEVVVGHPARRTWGELAGKWRRIVAESFAYHRSRGGSVPAWFITAAKVLVSPLFHIPKVLLSPKLTTTRDRLGAIGILFAIRPYRVWQMIRIAFVRRR